MWLLSILATLCFALALNSVWHGALPSGDDAFGAFSPWHQWSRHHIAQGRWPLWNPLLFCGTPLGANGQIGFFYPPNVLFWILPEALAFWLHGWIHLLVLTIGAFFWGRVLGFKRRAAFVVALGIGFGGTVAAHYFAGHVSWHAARAFWPWQGAWMVLFLRHGRVREAMLWGAATGSCALGGAPQVFQFGLLISMGVALIWVGVHRRVPRVGAALAGLGVAAGLVMLELAPLHELSQWSARGTGLEFEEATRKSATWRSLLSVGWPTLFGGSTGQQWRIEGNGHEDVVFIGLISFLLALCAPFLARRDGNATRAVWFLLGALALSFVLALGHRTPLYRALYDALPLFRLTRVPARWLELSAVAASLLAGYGVDGMLRKPLSPRKSQGVETIFRVFGVLSLSIFLGAIWVWILRALSQKLPWPLSRIPLELLWTAAGAGLRGALIAVCAFLLWKLWRRGQKRALPYFFALVALDVSVGFVRSGTETSPQTRNNLQIPPDLAQHFRSGERWDNRVLAGLNQAMPQKIALVNGYDPMNGRRYLDFVGVTMAISKRQSKWATSFVVPAYHPIWRVTGLTHTLSRKTPPFQTPDPRTIEGGEKLQLVASEQGWDLWRHPHAAWPRAYLAHQVLAVPPPKQLETLALLARQEWPQGFPVLVEKSAHKPTPNRAKPGAASAPIVIVETPNLLEWKISPSSPTVFVHCEALAPGWKAWVDGRPVPLQTANYLFRGVEVRPGNRRVTLIYDSATLRFSLFAALISIAGLTFGLIAAKRHQ